MTEKFTKVEYGRTSIYIDNGWYHSESNINYTSRESYFEDTYGNSSFASLNETNNFLAEKIASINYSNISRESYFEESYGNTSFESLNETSSAPFLQEEISFNSLSIVLSYIIFCGDGMLVGAYGTIIFYILRKQHRNKDSSIRRNTSKRYNRVISVCIGITIGFVSLTLPYALNLWNLNWDGFWGNLLLLANSGLNSVVYLLSQRLKRRR